MEGSCFRSFFHAIICKDQVDNIVRRDIPATFINSLLDLAQQNRRLHSANFQVAIASQSTNLMVINEALYERE